MPSSLTSAIASANSFGDRVHPLFIDGKDQMPRSGETILSENPSTGEPWGKVYAGGEGEINLAIRAAHECFENKWSLVGPKERERLIRRLADLIERDAEVITAIDAHECGNTIGILSTGGKATLLDVVNYFSGWPSKIAGQSFAPIQQQYGNAPPFTKVMQTVPEPIGVVGCVLPWNFPSGFFLNKVIPALAAGCTVVVKPSEQTPTSAIYLAQLFREAGFPDGAVNVVNGHGETAGAALCSHPLVKKISFTGSTEVGRAIATAAAPTFKRLTLELGGKSAFIVLDDANLDSAATTACFSGYLNAGQFCMCPSRLFVEESIFDRFIEKLQSAANRIVVGNATDPATTMGPVITRTDRDRIAAIVNTAKEDGADLIYGGNSLNESGHYYQPTLLAKGDTETNLAKTEVFGPVLLAVPFAKSNIDDLISRANETNYGLAASIWSHDYALANHLAQQLQAGLVGINSHGGIDSMIPFGGVKDSGIGREFGLEGFASFFETKSIHASM